MAEHEETLKEKIAEKIHGDSSSSSDSDDDKPSHADVLKSKVDRLFGREKPLHQVLGAGKRTHNLNLNLSLRIYHFICLDSPKLFYQLFL